jgi:hypothetical protein
MWLVDCTGLALRLFQQRRRWNRRMLTYTHTKIHRKVEPSKCNLDVANAGLTFGLA